MRRIFINIDGETRGPNLHNGVIGRQLNNCVQLPPCTFRKMKIDDIYKKHLQKIDDIGSDQRYLRDIILAIDSGVIHPALYNKSPGKLGYARWLTTANRILRVYISTVDPTSQFIILVKYIIFVYARSWFAIKYTPIFHQRPIHVFNMIQWVKNIESPTLIDIFNKTISRNGYSLHSENLSIAMLVDPRPNIRYIAVKRILTSRMQARVNVRKFIIPIINFDADDYYDLIKYDETWLESSLTIQYSSETLERYTNENIPIFQFEAYPSHTQGVERTIRLVSETASMYGTKEDRDWRIRITIDSRRKMPIFDSKKQFYIK